MIKRWRSYCTLCPWMHTPTDEGDGLTQYLDHYRRVHRDILSSGSVASLYLLDGGHDATG